MLVGSHVSCFSWVARILSDRPEGNHLTLFPAVSRLSRLWGKGRRALRQVVR